MKWGGGFPADGPDRRWPSALTGDTSEDHALFVSKDREAPGAATPTAWLPPRWFVLLSWHGHRALVRLRRGRLRLWRPKPGGWGALWLTMTGRRSGRPRQVVVRDFEDDRNLIAMAMNRSRWAEIDKNLDACAALRPAETAVVVLEPRDAGAAAEPVPAERPAAPPEGDAQ